MKKFFVLILVAFLLFSTTKAETVYVRISDDSYLNGRAEPHKRAEVTMKLYNGDSLEAVGFHGEWIEVVGGESGTSFCKAQYLSEIKDPVLYTNTSGNMIAANATLSTSNLTADSSGGLNALNSNITSLYKERHEKRKKLAEDFALGLADPATEITKDIEVFKAKLKEIRVN